MVPLRARHSVPGWRAVAALLVVAMLAACASDDADETQVRAQAEAQAKARAQAEALAKNGILDPYRQMLVLGPSANFDPARLPDQWYVASGGSRAPNIRTASKDGVLAVRFEGDGEGAILGRRMQVPLLNMPYLRWGWYVERPKPSARRTAVQGGEPPVLLRVVVGFRDTAEGEAEADPHAPPKIDRAISLEWRADNSVEPGASGSVAMRAGFKDSGEWMLEAVDLTRIYSRTWPQSPIGRANIALVAVGAGPTPVPTVGYVAEVVLSP